MVPIYIRLYSVYFIVFLFFTMPIHVSVNLDRLQVACGIFIDLRATYNLLIFEL